MAQAIDRAPWNRWRLAALLFFVAAFSQFATAVVADGFWRKLLFVTAGACALAAGETSRRRWRNAPEEA